MRARPGADIIIGTHATRSPGLAAYALTSPTENPSTAPAHSAQNGADLTPHALTVRYQAWGWPVSLRGDQVWLSLTVALTFPASLAEPVTAILCYCHPP